MVWTPSKSMISLARPLTSPAVTYTDAHTVPKRIYVSYPCRLSAQPRNVLEGRVSALTAKIRFRESPLLFPPARPHLAEPLMHIRHTASAHLCVSPAPLVHTTPQCTRQQGFGPSAPIRFKESWLVFEALAAHSETVKPGCAEGRVAAVHQPIGARN